MNVRRARRSLEGRHRLHAAAFEEFDDKGEESRREALGPIGSKCERSVREWPGGGNQIEGTIVSSSPAQAVRATAQSLKLVEASHEIRP
jgi:hypothetical protein